MGEKKNENTSMTKKQGQQLKKFKKFSPWIYKDPKRAELYAGTQFLSALGLFNYIEMLGAFLIGYFEKCQCGRIIKIQKHKHLKTTSKDRFNNFFSYLGKEYKNLLKQNPDIYDDLRNGLTHEFLPKRQRFSIIKVILKGDDNRKEQIIENNKNIKIINPIDKSVVNCGVVYKSLKQQQIYQICQIFPLKLGIDLGKSVERLIKRVERGKDRVLIRNFFETADQINLKNFK